MIHKLETKFIGSGEVKGAEFEMVKETSMGYVYVVDNSHYEVFLKKTTPICLDFEKRIYSETEFKEKYPKSKDFGSWAWTKNNLKDAVLTLLTFNNL